MADTGADFLREIGATAEAPTPVTAQAAPTLSAGQEFLREVSAAPAAAPQVQPRASTTTPPNPALQGLGFWAQQAGAGPAALAQHEAEDIASSQVPGIPLDVQSGADALTRLRLGAERNRMAQLNMLRDIYGPDAVRMDRQGRWIARTTDDAGKPKDVLVDEEAMTLKDVADVAHKFPAIALSVLATKGLPATSIMRQAIQGAFGWAGGEAATDVASRIGRTDLQPGEIATTRGAEALRDAAFGYAGGKTISALGTLGRLLRIAGNRTPEAFGEGASAAARARVEQARQATGASTGVMLEPTAGELTGNPIIQRLEAFFANIPLARGFILKNMERRIANERAIQTKLMEMAGGGAADVPEATKLGEQVIDAIGAKAIGLRTQAGELAGNLRQEATQTLTGPLDEITGRPLSPTAFGQRMITRGEAQLQSFKDKAEELFAPLRAAPEATQPMFDAAPIQKVAADIKDRLLKEAGGDVAKGLAPTGLTPVLDQVAKLSPTQSWFDLKDLRNAIYDRIGSPEPISDKGTKLLKELAGSVTQEMEKQAPKVFTPELLAQSKAANQFYRENVESFYQKGIAGMLKPRTESGAIDPERIASALLAGGKGSVTTYNTFRDFFTKAGRVNDMNRLLRDQLVDAGTDKATGLIRLEDMSAAVSKLEPEIVKELYGVGKQELLANVRQAQMGLRTYGKAGAVAEAGSQGAVEADALKEALARGDVKSGTLKALASTTADLQRAYSTELTKALQVGDTGLIEAAPEKFVRDFLLNPATSEKAASNAMQHLVGTGDDQLLGDVRRFYLADLFKAAATGSRGDVQQLVSMQTGSPLRNLDPQKFAVLLENPDVQRRMSLILGPEVANTVREFGIALSGRAGKDVAASTTGAFAGGAYAHQMIQLLGGKLSALKALPDLAQYRVMSYLLTHPESIKRFRTVGNALPEQVDGLVRATVLTPEFASALASDSATPQEAAKVAADIQKWARPQ